MSRVFRFSLTVVLLGLAALVPRATGASAQTLTPPPPPGATCQTTGSGIFCHGTDTVSETNLDTGVSCGTFELLNTFSGTVTYEIHFNSAGLEVKAAFHVNLTGTYINSVTGKTITDNTHYTFTSNFATPGDESTQTGTLTGAVNISTGRSVGLVEHDVGKIVFDPSGTILFEGGSHLSFTNFPAAVQAICTALA